MYDIFDTKTANTRAIMVPPLTLHPTRTTWYLMASSASAAPPPLLLPLEIASVYSSIQSALSAALRHELRRAENDNQVLLAAGRDIGPDNDAVLKFRQLWIEPGLCDEAASRTTVFALTLDLVVFFPPAPCALSPICRSVL